MKSANRANRAVKKVEYVPHVHDIWYSVTGSPSGRQTVERWVIARVLATRLVLRRGNDTTVIVSRRTNHEVGDTGLFQTDYYPGQGTRGLELEYAYRLKVSKFNFDVAVEKLRKALAAKENDMGVTRYASVTTQINTMIANMKGVPREGKD